MLDTSLIEALVCRARRRLRLQAALEGAALTTVAAAATALVAVYLARQGIVPPAAGLGLVAGCVLLVAAGAIAAATRRLPDLHVAHALDRASGLADRLTSACAFNALLRAGKKPQAETEQLMRAAIKDGVRVVAHADVRAAAPLTWPRDTRAAAAFVTVSTALAFLAWPAAGGRPIPVHVAVTVAGKPLPDQEESRGSLVLRRMHSGHTDVIDLGHRGRFATRITLRSGAYEIEHRANPAPCLHDRIAAMPCRDALVASGVVVGAAAQRSGPSYRVRCDDRECDLAIDLALDRGRGGRGGDQLEPEDFDYAHSLLQDLRAAAQQEGDTELEKFARAVDQMLAQHQLGLLSRKQLLERLAAAEKRFLRGNAAAIEEGAQDLKETGRQLKKHPITKALGDALAAGELDKSKQELEKLANAVEGGQLSSKQEEKLAEAFKQAAQRFDNRQRAKDRDSKREMEGLEAEIRRLERKRDDTQDEAEKRRLAQRLQQKKRELNELRREKEERQRSQTRRTLQRLHRNMEQAARDLRQPKESRRRIASSRMKDIAGDTGRVSHDQRRIRAEKKVASQLTDLREALRRAKHGGRSGPKDLFGRNRRGRDFARRARGERGEREVWKRRLRRLTRAGSGSGQRGGAGQGGSSWGDDHDPNLLGDPTKKSGKTTDSSVSGVHGRGPSTRETVLAAAQKGFASRSYEQVYQRYRAIIEDVMTSEKVPSGYKYYIKRYFAKIRPQSSE